MTGHDWVGTILTVVIFFLMLGLYIIVLRPKNRDKFEQQKYIPLDDEEQKDSGEKNG